MWSETHEKSRITTTKQRSYLFFFLFIFVFNWISSTLRTPYINNTYDESVQLKLLNQSNPSFFYVTYNDLRYFTFLISSWRRSILIRLIKVFDSWKRKFVHSFSLDDDSGKKKLNFRIHVQLNHGWSKTFVPLIDFAIRSI